MSKKSSEESRQGEEAQLDNKHRGHCAEHKVPPLSLSTDKLREAVMLVISSERLVIFLQGRGLCRGVQGGPWSGEQKWPLFVFTHLSQPFKMFTLI